MSPVRGVYGLETMRVLMGLLVALFGAVAGAAIGVALTYVLVSGAEADALTWLAVGLLFGFACSLGGAVATGLLCRRFFPSVFLGSELTRRGRAGIGAPVVYGIGASLAVIVVGPIVTVEYAARDTSGDTSAPDLLAGELCTKAGVRYVGTTEAVRVCFTLTPDRSTWVEIGWRFGHESGCAGGATYMDHGNTLTGRGRIIEPGFTATIRGAQASGAVEDTDVCMGKTVTWRARRRT